ncbi:class I SAM-dependent methyltransferase [Congregibacter litoralis]|uniref:Putative methyltransferase n=1 Tax=Congregibacter litoralis KT71 TaxID=314285 RepID=A4A3J4_9GAMM|nr:class I SAM-dependent methyltransferase [Congregibacter litoralis]EAQ99267.2 putative methyltransferase [Congregibacter litoralis KT71]
MQKVMALVSGLVLAPAILMSAPATAALDWDKALNGEHRSEKNKARDEFRHPRETLEFFGLKEDMTVVELSPGGGWYTEVLAPLLHDAGSYYAAHNSPNGGAYSRRSLGGYLQKLGKDNDTYGNVTVTTLGPADSVVIAPAGTADMVLAFRNVHSWMRADTLANTLLVAYDALKPGGVFGVVQHRAKDGRDPERMKATGYVSEDYIIAAARSVGFELDGRSEVNANPKDRGDYEDGVWELPPSLNTAEENREAHRAIGESDRMTLKFVKSAS